MCGDKDTVIRGPVCDRGPVDRGNQAVAGGPDLKSPSKHSEEAGYVSVDLNASH